MNTSPVVIWSYQQINSVLGRPAGSSISDVPAERIIRNHRGVEVSRLRFVEIQKGVKRRMEPLLRQFKPTATYKLPGLKYFDAHHRSKLKTLCRQLGQEFPELALCEAHRKARFLIKDLMNRRLLDQVRQRKASAKAKQSPPGTKANVK